MCYYKLGSLTRCIVQMYIAYYIYTEGGGGVRTIPWNLQSLISPILLEMKQIS